MDGNHSTIVQALKAWGASVHSLASLGGGVPDLLVGYRGNNLLVEVKDPEKPPSKRALTGDQERWTENWRGQWVKVETIEEAITVLRWIDSNG